jgi:predicted nucleic acid-binding protein
MMKILADADILLELFLNRRGKIDAARTLIDMAQSRQIQLYVTDLCLQKLHVYLDHFRIQSPEKAIARLKHTCKRSILTINRHLIEAARLSPLDDFEAALEVACASHAQLDAIVTLNIAAFNRSDYPVWSVDELVCRYQLRQITRPPKPLPRLDPSKPSDQFVYRRIDDLSSGIDGILSPQKRQQFEKWISEEPKMRQLYLQLLMLKRSIRTLPPPAFASSDPSLVVEQVFNRIDRRSRAIRQWTGMAVAAVLVTITGVWQVLERQYSPNPVAVTSPSPVELESILIEDPLAPLLNLSKSEKQAIALDQAAPANSGESSELLMLTIDQPLYENPEADPLEEDAS